METQDIITNGNQKKIAEAAAATTPAADCGSRIGRRGFGSMDPLRRRQMASMGGKAVRPENRSYSKNRRLAAESGRKGGQAVASEKRTYSINKQLAITSGRKGGSS